MEGVQTLDHTMWGCKSHVVWIHVVWIPKYRRYCMAGLNYGSILKKCYGS